MPPRGDASASPRPENAVVSSSTIHADCVSGPLRQHEAAWATKGLLRRVYRDWHTQIARRLSKVPGATVELGSGIGRLKEVVPSILLTDVEATPYAEVVAPADALPFEDGGVANLVLIDVFHHLDRPNRFLDEAVRVLAPGGRVVLLEPYCSPASTVAYRHLHHEDLDLGRPGLEADEVLAESPWSANIAVPTIAFFREIDELRRRWPQLAMIERRRLTLFVYLLSGGYSRRALAPGFLYRPLALLEQLLFPLLPVAAFRCLVVLERR
jgi:SAM-dependent methyltransferase